MTPPVQRFKFGCLALSLSRIRSRFPLWVILAGCFCLAVGLAGADEQKSSWNDSLSTDSLAIAEQLKEAFDAGFVVGPRSAQQAQGRFERIKRLAPADARIDYSYGLMLVKQSQMKQANAHFEAAVAQNGIPFWPAWKAAIWSHLIEKRFESGLNRLVEFSILVHDAGSSEGLAGEPPLEMSPEIAENQRDAARWFGQLFEALALLPDSKKYKALIEERQSRVQDALGDDLAFSFDEGRELLRARAAEMELAADAARDTAGQLAKRRKLDKDLDAIDKDRGTAPQTKEEWKKWIDELLLKYDKQLVQFDREYQALSARADGLQRLYMQASALLTATKANMTLMHHQGLGPAPFVAGKEQMVMYNDQMLAYQVEYNVVVDQTAGVAQRASGIANHRATAIARYEKETGDTIPKNPDLDKWATRLSDKRPKLAAKVATKAAKKDPADKKRVPSLKSLMPLDLERERDDILSSFGLRPALPAVAPPNLEASPAVKPEPRSERNSASPVER